MSNGNKVKSAGFMLILAFLAGLIGSGVCAADAKAATAASSLLPEADAMLSSKPSERDTNFSNPQYNQILLRTREPANPDDLQYGIFRFNVSAVTDSIVSAKLRLFFTTQGPGNVGVYAVANDSWGETAITWNNKPAYGNKIAEFNNLTPNGYNEVDLTEYIRQQKALDGKASLMLVAEPGAYRQVFTRERAAANNQQPFLDIATEPYQPFTEVLPIADTYISSKFPGANYGASTELFTNEASGDQKRIYLKYDVSNLNAFNASRLRLQMKTSLGGSGDLEIYAVENDSWTENGLTWNNAPAQGRLLSVSANVPGWGDTWLDFYNLTEYLQEQKNKDGITSLMVKNKDALAVNRYFIAREDTKTYGVLVSHFFVKYDGEGPQIAKQTQKGDPIRQPVVLNEMNKRITVYFDEPLYNNTPSEAALKQNVTLSVNGGAYWPLGANDSVILQEPVYQNLSARREAGMVIQLAAPLAGSSLKVKVAANTLRDQHGNVQANEIITGEAAIDSAAPVLEKAVRLDRTNKVMTVNANEGLYNNLADMQQLKAAVAYAPDGTHFRPLTATEKVSLSTRVEEANAYAGYELILSLDEKVTGSAAKVKIAGGAVRDIVGNVTMAEYVSDAMAADTAAPVLVSAYASNFNKEMTLTFNEPIASHAAVLKNALSLSRNSGAYQALAVADEVRVHESSIRIYFANTLPAGVFNVRLAGSSVKDYAGNIAGAETITASISRIVPHVIFAPPSAAELQNAMVVGSNITFSGEVQSNGGNLSKAKTLATVAQAIVSGNNDPEVVGFYVNSVKKMVANRQNMPNMSGGLEGRSISPVMYAVALLWHDQSFFQEKFTAAELDKIKLLAKAGVVASAYSQSDYGADGSLRFRGSKDMNGAEFYLNGANWGDPNMLVFHSSAIILGFQHVQALLAGYNHESFKAELNANGLVTVYESFSRTPAATVEAIIKSPKLTLKTKTLDQYLENPIVVLEKLTEDIYWLIAQDGEAMGQKGMEIEFEAVDQSGPRESSGYVGLGVFPNLQSRMLMSYLSYYDAPGNEERGEKIDSLQRAGISDYYSKTVNGYFSQCWFAVETQYPNLELMDGAIATGLLKLVLFNDSFDYADTAALTAGGWVIAGGAAQPSLDTIIPYNHKEFMTLKLGAMPKDPSEKVAVLNNGRIHTQQSFGNISYMAWVKGIGGAGEVGLTGRVLNGSNYYKLSYKNGQLNIIKVLNGAETVLSSKSYMMSPDKAYRLRGVFADNRLLFYVNGVLELTSTDYTFGQGGVGLIAAGASAKFDAVLVQPDQAPAPYFTHPGGMHSEGQLRSAARNSQLNIQPWADAKQELISRADSYAGEPSSAVSSFNVPDYNLYPAEHTEAAAVLQQDANAAYTNALAYRITGNSLYADKAKAFLNDWAFNNHTVAGVDGAYVMAYAGVALIHTAELMRDYPGWGGKAQFEVWLKNVYLDQAANPLKTQLNNQGAWGNYGAISAYYYLNDAVNVNSEIVRLKHLIDISIAADGSMPQETARGGEGLWYTYFALAPMTAAAHVAKEATGTDVFNWTSPGGKTIKSALDYLLYYVQNPAQWPHYANPRLPAAHDKWPNNLFEAMSDYYDKPEYAAFAAQKRPLTAIGHHYAWAVPTLMKGGAVLYQTGFDRMTAGHAPQGWSLTNSPDSSALVVNTPSWANRSLQIADTNPAGASFARLSFPAQQGMMEVEWKLMYNTLFSYAKFGVRSGGAYAVEMFTTAAGLAYKNQAGAETVIQTLAPGVWHTVRLVLNPQTNTADIYVNGVLKAAAAPFRSAVTGFNNVEFAGGWGAAGTIFIDDVKITN